MEVLTIEFTVEELHKSFGAKHVLRGINLRAESGSALGLLGRNGAGKTTTIRIIMDVFPADSGRVRIDGAPIDREKVKIGYLPEERGLYAKNKIGEQLIYLARLRGVSTADAKKTISYWLKRLEVYEYVDKKLEVLSKGNQQKVQLAAALIATPDMVILDEPFSGLDPVNAALLEDVVKEQIADGKLVLFSSHQMNYIEEFCDNIAILNEGKIVLAGNLDEIKRGYDRKNMVVRSVDTEKILSYCRTLPQSLVASTGMEDGDVRVQLTSEDGRNELIGALAQQNFDIDAIEVFAPSLSDIFVEYTGERKEDENEAV